MRRTPRPTADQPRPRINRATRARGSRPLNPQLGVDAWCPVDAAAAPVHRPDPGGQRRVGHARVPTAAACSRHKIRSARPRARDTADDRYRLLHRDEPGNLIGSSPWRRRPPLLPGSPAPAAAPGSRRSRASSSRSAVVNPDRCPASTSACWTQRRTAVSVRSRSADLPEALARRPDQRDRLPLNSAVNIRLARCAMWTPARVMLPSSLSVSTKSGQVQQR